MSKQVAGQPSIDQAYETAGNPTDKEPIEKARAHINAKTDEENAMYASPSPPPFPPSLTSSLTEPTAPQNPTTPSPPPRQQAWHAESAAPAPAKKPGASRSPNSTAKNSSPRKWELQVKGKSLQRWTRRITRGRGAESQAWRRIWTGRKRSRRR